MTDHKNSFGLTKKEKIPADLAEFLNKTKNYLKGYERRLFMARVVKLLGNGGQRKAEKELGWARGVIRKGTQELETGAICADNFSARGRHPAERHLPNLLEDIRNMVEPLSQIDPAFRTTNAYTSITASEVRRRLITEKQYLDEELPCTRTIQKKLNDLNFRIQKVKKGTPKINPGNR